MPAIDRLSSLPDPLIIHILRFLPTKEAVATSILSARWTNLWTSLPEFRFDDCDFIGTEFGPLKFGKILYKILLQTEPNPIHHFHLQIQNPISEASDVNSWISAVVKRNIKSLSLHLSLNQCFKMPSNLFTSKTLVSLNLHGRINMNVLPSVNLPCLKSLNLHHVWYSNCCAFQRLLSGCPLLEYMVICTDYDVIWEYNPISLRTLNIIFCSLSGYHNHKLRINASFLQNLLLRGKLQGDYYQLRAENLRTADITVSSDSITYLINFLLDVCNVRILKLSEDTIKVFGFQTDYILPEFCNLERLELTSSFCDWDLVAKLLERSPRLEVLIIRKVENENKVVIEPCWTRPPQNVPICLKLKLKEFQFKGLRGHTAEMEIATYILRNANVLRTMRVSVDSLLSVNDKFRITNELFMFPAGSERCHLHFDEIYFS